MHRVLEIWSQISRAAAGISFGASLVILAIELRSDIGGVGGSSDVLAAALDVSMAAVYAWVVCQVFRPQRQQQR